MVEPLGLGPMEPQAGIVNYYPVDATMGGEEEEWVRG